MPSGELPFFRQIRSVPSIIEVPILVKMSANADISGPFDAYDRKILSILSGDGRMTMTELARRIGLSKTPCQARVRKLEAEGFIRVTAPFWTPKRWVSDT
jgi:hypothetical protein